MSTPPPPTKIPRSAPVYIVDPSIYHTDSMSHVTARDGIVAYSYSR